MLDTLKTTGKNLGSGINRAWDRLTEGWHELLNRSSNALTHFTHRTRGEPHMDDALAMFPRWSLLAGELEETRSEVVIRIELPGMDKSDCQITIEGNVLHLTGEKRFERETEDSTYHVMERAYGSFERHIPLPVQVDPAQGRASFKDGVLVIRLPKMGRDDQKSIPVT